MVIILFSCNSPQKKHHSANTDYNKVLDSASRTYDAGNPQKAMRYLNAATKNYHHINPRQWFSYYTYHYNYYYFIQGDMDTAMLYVDSMLALFDTPEKKLKYTSQIGQADFYKGGIFFDENKYDEAYQYYYKGRLIAINSADECTLSDYNYRLGMIMYKKEHYRTSGLYFKMGLQQAGTCEPTYRLFLRRQELFNNTGLCYSKVDDGDSALLYFNRGLKFIDSAGAPFKAEKNDLDVCRGVIYGNMANIYIKRNNYQVAEGLLNKSISINLKVNNDNRDAQLSELKLAHLYLLQNKSDSLIFLLHAIQGQFDTIKNQVAEADWNFLMSKYYTQKKQPKFALGYLVRYDALKDTIATNNKPLKETDINEQMESQVKNHEFESLKKNKRLKQFYLKIAIVFGLMLLMIIFLIVRNWQKSKKNIKTLGGLNSQIKEQNDNLEQALTELGLSSQEKDRILRTVAHDLRNPLGGIASLTGLMAEESEYTGEQKELINLIKETSNNSLELINEILEITDNIPGGLLKEKERVEINSLVSKSVELMRFKAAEKDQQIVLELLERPVELFISREKIWRVISNLISNALKFSPAGSVVSVKATSDENAVTISVTDNGIGIPDEMKDQVFNTFTNAKRPGTAGEKSFGLGLSICQQIVESHNGKIWFESAAGSTSFYISLPVI